jgi:hypothetical protein
VPLSEHEQQILAEIEKRLAEDDPKFVQQARSRSDPIARAKLGIGFFLAGFVTLIGFLLSSRVAVGVVAFAAMVGGLVLIGGAARLFTIEREMQGPHVKARFRDYLIKLRTDWRGRYRRR